MNPHVVAFYYLKKLCVPAQVESQIVTGAGNRYEYEALSRSALACLPRVTMLKGGDGKQQGGGRRVYEAENEAEAADVAISDDDNLPDELKEAIAESAAWLTQTKKQRAQLEAARSFFRKPANGGNNNADKGARIAALKAKLPCKKCGALGHWYRECPMGQSEKTERVWTCATATCHGKLSDCVLIVLDTACAKTVAGAEWEKKCRQEFQKRWQLQLENVEEKECFRERKSTAHMLCWFLCLGVCPVV
eukprot:5089401-Amphidinium_carterae.2